MIVWQRAEASREGDDRVSSGWVARGAQLRVRVLAARVAIG